jgi:hypothetical protein
LKIAPERSFKPTKAICVLATDTIDRLSNSHQYEADFYVEPFQLETDSARDSIVFTATVDLVGLETDPQPDNNSLSVTHTYFNGQRRFIGFVPICFGVESSGRPTGCPSDPTLSPFRFPDSLNRPSWHGTTDAMMPTANLWWQELPSGQWVFPGATWYGRVFEGLDSGQALTVWIRSRLRLAKVYGVNISELVQPDVVLGLVAPGSPVTGTAGADRWQPGTERYGAGHSAWELADEGRARRWTPWLLGALWGLEPSTIDCAMSPGIGQLGMRAEPPDQSKYVFLPPTTKSVMSTCDSGDTWLTYSEYRTLITGRMQTPADAVGGSVPQQLASANGALGMPVLAAADSSAYLLLTGAVARDGTFGTLAPAVRVEPPADPGEVLTSPDGQFCVELSGETGPLDRNCFTPPFTNPLTGTPVDGEAFTVTVAVPDGTSRLALTAGGTELDAIDDAGPPTLTAAARANETWTETQTITWSATGLGDQSETNVLYSPNGGDSWLPYAPSTAQKQLTIDPAGLQAGRSNLFRIVVSSGLSAATTDVGPIFVPNGIGIDLGLGGGCALERDCDPPSAPPPSSGPDFSWIAVVGLGVAVVVGLVVVAAVVVGRNRRPAYATPAGRGYATPPPPPPPGAATHTVPASGLTVWSWPDATGQPLAQLSGGTPVTAIESSPTGWIRVQLATGESGWVDGRQLIPTR